MNMFAAFGVGLGNLGKRSRARIATPDWIAALNRGLADLRIDSVVKLPTGTPEFSGAVAERSDRRG
jgi:hypothetical protein